MPPSAASTAASGHLELAENGVVLRQLDGTRASAFAPGATTIVGLAARVDER